MTYRVVIDGPAEKDLRHLSGLTWQRVRDRIRSLANTPRPRGCLKLTGTDDRWRIRVGQYRVIYSVDDDEQIVRIEYVRHRRDAYR